MPVRTSQVDGTEPYFYHCHCRSLTVFPEDFEGLLEVERELVRVDETTGEIVDTYRGSDTYTSDQTPVVMIRYNDGWAPLWAEVRDADTGTVFDCCEFEESVAAQCITDEPEYEGQVGCSGDEPTTGPPTAALAVAGLGVLGGAYYLTR